MLGPEIHNLQTTYCVRLFIETCLSALLCAVDLRLANSSMEFSRVHLGTGRAAPSPAHNVDNSASLTSPSGLRTSDDPRMGPPQPHSDRQRHTRHRVASSLLRPTRHIPHTTRYRHISTSTAIGWSVKRPLPERPEGVMAGTSTIASMTSVLGTSWTCLVPSEHCGGHSGDLVVHSSVGAQCRRSVPSLSLYNAYKQDNRPRTCDGHGLHWGWLSSLTIHATKLYMLQCNT